MSDRRRAVFVTGATGFLGTALVERLVAAGERVTALVRGRSASDAVDWLARRGVSLVTGDVTRPEGLARALEGSDVVVHAAAVIGYRRRLAGAMQRTNVLGTRAVVGACLAAGVGRLVHVSSIAAVGVADEPALLDEESPWNADVLDAPYYDTKRAAEEEVAAGVDRGLDATTVNPAAIYGPSVAPSNSGHVILHLLGRERPLVPPGGINVVPLETVVEGVLAAAERGRTGRRYILGGENLEIAELARRVGRAAGRELRPRVLPRALGPVLRRAMEVVEPLVPDRAWFTPDMCALFGRWMWFDTSRAARELGVVAAPLDACLERAVAQLRRDGRL